MNPVYGTPRQFAELLASVAELVDKEPDDTFVDDDVRRLAVHLVGCVANRLAGTDLPARRTDGR